MITATMNKANLTPDDKESTITTDDDSSTSNSNLLFTSLDTNSKMVLKHLLDSWDMSTLYEPCIGKLKSNLYYTCCI